MYKACVRLGLRQLQLAHKQQLQAAWDAVDAELRSSAVKLVVLLEQKILLVQKAQADVEKLL